MMLPPSPRLRTTTPKHWPSVSTVRCPAMFSVVATIMGDSSTPALQIEACASFGRNPRPKV
jgi:hypothetical protein